MVAQVDSLYMKSRPWKLWSRILAYVLFEGRPLTTRGQWINPLLFANFAIAKRLPQMKRVEKPVFIVGTGRSGTTILGILLSMHRNVGFLNEPKALWHAVYPHEDLIGSYSRGKASYRLGESDADQHVIRSARRLYGAYLAISFSSRVVDKYPEMIFRIPFIKKIFPDSKFLFLARNGWDTCCSIEAWSGRLGKQKNGETHDWWGANNRKWNFLVDQVVPGHKDLAPYKDEMREWTNHVDMAAVEWIVTMREGMDLEQECPDDVLRVHYEKLCDDPVGALSEIVNFCNLDCDPVFLEYAEKILHRVSPRPALELAGCLQQPFLQTMHQLGYE